MASIRAFKHVGSDDGSRTRACRLTRQVSAYYDEVLRALAVFPLNQHFDRSWTAHVAVKSALYEAESQMQAAAAQRAEDNVHIEITRLKVSKGAFHVMLSSSQSFKPWLPQVATMYTSRSPV
jgi:programmed cell death 6-interacting protein